MSLQAAKEALLRKHYMEAIALLTEYCDGHPDPQARDYVQAQMWLVTAYQRTGRADKALAVCDRLADHPDPQLQSWRQKSIASLQQQLQATAPPVQPNDDVASVVRSRPQRYRKTDVTLAAPRGDFWRYVLGATATLSLVAIATLAFYLWLCSLFTLTLTARWWVVAIAATVVTDVLLFFLSPWIVDITQRQYHRTQWVTLADWEERSPEAVATIERFCECRQRDIPRLGESEDPLPVAFVYGILPNTTRLVLSRGLLESLDDDEIAAIVAYLLGRTTNGSAAIATFASAIPQVLYLGYVRLHRFSFQVRRGRHAWRGVAAIARVLYEFSTIPLLLLSRTANPLCDRTAAEMTGNPNAIARALTNMARQIVQQTQHGTAEHRLLASTRGLGCYDPQTVVPVGLAFAMLQAGAAPPHPYDVFLWEMVNPWGRWWAWQSSHPPIGQRLMAIAAFAKQLGLVAEYDLAQLVARSRTLDRARLFRRFWRDLAIYYAPALGVLLGLGIAQALYWLYDRWLPLSLGMVGLGLGLMLQGTFRYPDFRRVADTSLAALLADPYASTLRGYPVQLPGELVAYRLASNFVGVELDLEDVGGAIALRLLPDPITFVRDYPAIVRQLEARMGESVTVVGWFRRARGIVVEVAYLQPLLADASRPVSTMRSYHQLWNNVSSSLLVLLGLGILAVRTLLL